MMSKALGSCTYMRDPDGDTSPWLRMGSALSVVVAWGVDRQMEDIPLCLILQLKME